MVYGAGALGTCATAILRALYPDVDVLVVARFEAQAEMARKLGATVIGHTPAMKVIEEAAAWSGGVLRDSDGLPMAFPGFIDVVYDTVGKQETFEVGTRVLKARGTLVKAGVHGPTWWEDTPLYFKEISMVGSNAFGFEEVRRRAQARHRALSRPRVERPGRSHRHAHPHVPPRQTGATRSRRSPPRTRPARSRSRSTSEASAVSAAGGPDVRCLGRAMRDDVAGRHGRSRSTGLTSATR